MNMPLRGLGRKISPNFVSGVQFFTKCGGLVPTFGELSLYTPDGNWFIQLMIASGLLAVQHDQEVLNYLPNNE